jgi:hypothetical protein
MGTDVSLTLVFSLAAQGLIILSGFIVFAMIGEVNRKLPDERRTSYLFGHYSKHVRIFREYRNFYPAGTLHVWFALTLALALILGAASAWLFGLFR